jgi:hypothetical protein
MHDKLRLQTRNPFALERHNITLVTRCGPHSNVHGLKKILPCVDQQDASHLHRAGLRTTQSPASLHRWTPTPIRIFQVVQQRLGDSQILAEKVGGVSPRIIWALAVVLPPYAL